MYRIDKTRVASQLESLGLAIGYFINICLNITKTKGLILKETYIKLSQIYLVSNFFKNYTNLLFEKKK